MGNRLYINKLISFLFPIFLAKKVKLLIFNYVFPLKNGYINVLIIS